MVTDATVSGARQCSYCRSGFKSRRSPTLIDDGALVERKGAGPSLLKPPVRVRHAPHAGDVGITVLPARPENERPIRVVCSTRTVSAK